MPYSESNQRRRPNSPLTKGDIDKLKPAARTYRRADGQGLYLQVEPNGSKHWRMAYRFPVVDAESGVTTIKQKTLAFGSWPHVDLIEARKKREAAKDELRAHRDPGAAFKGAKPAAGCTFGDVAAEVLAKMERENKRAATLKKNRWLLQDLAAPLKDLPIASIDVPAVYGLLEKIELSGRYESAIRLRGAMSSVFSRAMMTGRASVDPTLPLRGQLTQPTVKHHPGITDPQKVGRLLMAIDAYPESKIVALALKLAPYVFLRPIELRAGQWPEIDFREKVWLVPASRTKMNRPHVVPLAPQVIEILEQVQKLTGSGEYIFPHLRTPERPMSEGTLKAALALIGYGSDVQTPHGFRSTASTLIHKARKWERHIVEFQLAHAPGSDVEKAYDHNQWLEERTEIMLWWANELDRLRRKARVHERVFG